MAAAGHELQHLMADPSSTRNDKTEHVRAHSLSPAPASSEVSLEKNKSQPGGWTPFYLQTTTLIGFVVVYLVLLLGIIVLAIADTKKHGISTAKSSQHYLWTYGPTAVLAIVAALWGQVEYRAKQAMPWKVLQQRSTPASKTLLLDHITPSLAEALLASVRSSHWPVAIAITNSLLIKLLTVASTGLLVLQTTPIVHHNCHITAADDFVTSFNTSTIGSAPVLSTLAIQNGTIPYPPGTSRDAAFQQLKAPSSLSGLADIEVEGLVRSFHAGLVCETAAVTSFGSACSDRQCHGMNLTVDITSPTCTIKSFNYTRSCGWQLGPTECGFGDAWGVGCDSTVDGHDTNRLVFTIGWMKQNVTANDLGLKIISDNTTTILCEPRYNITSAHAKMDRSGNLRDVAHEPAAQNSSQPFPAWDLVDGLHTSVQAAGLMLDNPYGYTTWASKPWDPLWTLFESWTGAAYPSSNLKDAKTLESAADELFSMVTAQMAKRNLMSSSVSDSTGTCYGTEDRLRVRGLSLYLMGASLILLTLSTILLLYTAPRSVTSRDPATIGGLALVLSQSPSLLSRLSSYGFSDTKAIQKQLQGDECQSFVSADGERCQFSVELTPKGEVPSADATSELDTSSPKARFWRPLSLHPIFKIFVIVFLLALVVILEAVYSTSQKHNGIAQVDADGYVRFSWVYVPAVVMLTAQTVVGMVAFSSVLIFPYFLLRTRTSNTRNDILRDYVSQTAVQSVWKSMANRHFPVLFMALAMLLTPLLTIAVSGLYTPQPTGTEIDVTLSVVNQLNASFVTEDLLDYTPFKQASANVGLLLTQNFTYPLWTYDELAFPEVKLSMPAISSTSSNASAGSNFTTILPAIRAELNCTIAPDSPKNFTSMLYSTNGESFKSFEDVGCDPPWPAPGPNPFGFFSGGYQDSAESTAGSSFCGAYGTSETAWRAFVCESVINQLDVSVTFDATTLTVLHATPDERTAREFSNRALAPNSLSSYPSSMIPSLFGSANFAGETSGYYDPAFQAVIYESGTTGGDPNAFPMAAYMDDADAGFERIAAHLRHVYRTVIAQSANTAIRVPFDATAALAPPSATVNATLVDPRVYRLRQSAISTRILDGLLVAVALCLAASFALMRDAAEVLPKNPASIAAGASLIAGGGGGGGGEQQTEMLRADVLPREAQWYDDAELEKKGVWAGCMFSLGWWDVAAKEDVSRQGAGKKRRFGLDIGKAER